MYISLLSLLIIGGFIIYFVWQSNRRSKNHLDIINLLCAMVWLEKNYAQNAKVYKHIKGQEHRYAFLLHYLEDIQNLKVNELNNKWIDIYNFFHSRTSFYGSTVPVSYTNYGRITPTTIMHIADMYKNNSNAIGSSLWEDSSKSSNRIGKEDLKKGDYYYPHDIKELIKLIEAYDRNYTGHVLMEKR